jgi:hypothetical protein
MENNMVLAHTQRQKVRLNVENGKTARELDGSQEQDKKVKLIIKTIILNENEKMLIFVARRTINNTVHTFL